MSLCVAWKWKDERGCQITLAADSCVVLFDEVMDFHGVKVLTVPIRIRPCGSDPDPIFETTYGMAFAGSYLAAFLIREVISEVLTNLQHVGNAGTISFAKICDLVFAYHKHFHDKIKVGLKGSNEIDFILSGYCPASNQIRAAKFYVCEKDLKPYYREILIGDGYSFETMGDVKARARFSSLMKMNLDSPPCRVHFASFRRLYDIIKDSEYPNVAGAIQYGDFTGIVFKRVGTFQVLAGKHSLEARPFICGSNPDEIYEPKDNYDFHVSLTHGNPFAEDIGSYCVTPNYIDKGGNFRRIDEQITIIPNDDRWNQWFAEECEILKKICGDGIAIHHVGSTSVSGMSAVPHIDILIMVIKVIDVHSSPYDFSLECV